MNLIGQDAIPEIEISSYRPLVQYISSILLIYPFLVVFQKGYTCLKHGVMLRPVGVVYFCLQAQMFDRGGLYLGPSSEKRNKARGTNWPREFWGRDS